MWLREFGNLGKKGERVMSRVSWLKGQLREKHESLEIALEELKKLEVYSKNNKWKFLDDKVIADVLALHSSCDFESVYSGKDKSGKAIPLSKLELKLKEYESNRSRIRELLNDSEAIIRNKYFDLHQQIDHQVDDIRPVLLTAIQKLVREDMRFKLGFTSQIKLELLTQTAQTLSDIDIEYKVKWDYSTYRANTHNTFTIASVNHPWSYTNKLLALYKEVFSANEGLRQKEKDLLSAHNSRLEEISKANPVLYAQVLAFELQDKLASDSEEQEEVEEEPNGTDALGEEPKALPAAKPAKAAYIKDGWWINESEGVKFKLAKGKHGYFRMKKDEHGSWRLSGQVSELPEAIGRLAIGTA